MLTWNSLIEDAPTAGEIADMTQRREDLQIRSLLEFPALRVALGLDQPATVATVEHLAPKPATAKKRSAKRSSKNASAPRTNKATSTRSAGPAQHPRFDRRALLESDRVA